MQRKSYQVGVWDVYTHLNADKPTARLVNGVDSSGKYRVEGSNLCCPDGTQEYLAPHSTDGWAGNPDGNAGHILRPVTP